MTPKKESPQLMALQWPLTASSIEPEDDWTGLGDPKERRKRQNRLNQRAYRQRKRAERLRASIHDKIQSKIEEMISTGQVTSSLPGRPSPPESPKSIPKSISTASDSSTSVQQWEKKMCCLGNQIDRLLEELSQKAFESYVIGSPSADHLLTLCKVNVFRAFMSNMHTLGMSPGPEWMDDDALSPFSTMLPGYVEEGKLPVSLRPTSLQQKMLHHPWLDFFPFPRIRDNLILAGDFDDHPLCLDIMGFWDLSSESCGLLVWGEPTDPCNWEVSEYFLRKWPWVVAGCPELLDSTNRWRSLRGERLIFRYL